MHLSLDGLAVAGEPRREAADAPPGASVADLHEMQTLLMIDEDDLATEWHQQPIKYARVARLAARYEAALADAELTVKATEARLYGEIRDTPSEKRLSEEGVKQAMRRNPEWLRAERARIECLERAKISAGLVRAMDQRERSLKWITVRQFGEWDGRDSGLPKGVIEDVLSRAAKNQQAARRS